RLGPGILAYLDSPGESNGVSAAGAAVPPGSSWPFPVVAVISLKADEPTASPPTPSQANDGQIQRPVKVPIADAVENALKTVLALTALDEKRNSGRSLIRTHVVAGATVTTLDHPVPFAYAIDRAGSRLVVGTSADSVARYLQSASDVKAGERFRRLKAAAFPDDGTFFCVDLV